MQSVGSSPTSLRANQNLIASSSREIRAFVSGTSRVDWRPVELVSRLLRDIIGTTRNVFVREHRMGPYCDRDMLEEAYCAAYVLQGDAKTIFNGLDRTIRTLNGCPSGDITNVKDYRRILTKIADFLDGICNHFATPADRCAAD